MVPVKEDRRKIAQCLLCFIIPSNKVRGVDYLPFLNNKPATEQMVKVQQRNMKVSLWLINTSHVDSDLMMCLCARGDFLN